MHLAFKEAPKIRFSGLTFWSLFPFACIPFVLNCKFDGIQRNIAFYAVHIQHIFASAF